MRIAAAIAALLGWCAAARAAADGEGDFVPPQTRPLVLLVQGDALVASAPTRFGDPAGGASLRLRRVRAGEDLAGRSWRVRLVLEAQSADAGGQHFAPVEGGRLAGPLRVTEAFASWRPHRVFHLDAGAISVPFSLTRQVGEADLRLPERSVIAQTLAPDFRVGAGIGGDLGALAYAAAVMSSSRFIDGDLFQRGALVAARLAAEPIGPVGVTPWRRAPDDPWTDWFRFRHGVSFMYGTLYEAKSIGAGMDLSAQWRRLSTTSEYIFVHAPSGNQQGVVFEPGVSLIARRLDVAARGGWNRAADANGWSGGAALTFYAKDPCARLQAGFERHTGPGPLPAATYALARITLAID
ncbi:MAG TPA: hypothetical protein VKQ32_25690 [Polyangia bacterium]|nr:hypothetical protein [Polyangia bacterium]